MADFVEDIKAEVEESNIRLSFEDDLVFACEVIDKLLWKIECLEKSPIGLEHPKDCMCTTCY